MNKTLLTLLLIPVLGWGQHHPPTGFKELDKNWELLYQVDSLHKLSDSLDRVLWQLQPLHEPIPIPATAKRMAMKFASVIPDSSAWVGFYFEIDHDMYLEMGSDTNIVLKNLLGYFNGMRQEYALAGIRIYIAGYKIWKNPDPYQNTSSSAQGLYAFAARMDSLNLPYDLFQLLSRHCVGCGGIAFQGPVLGYQAYYRTSFCGMLPGYYDNALVRWLPWNLMVTSHEGAHNIAIPHTHQMAWNGNSTMIDSCACQANSGYCVSGSYVGGGNVPIPSDGGTVESYCHLLQNVGINGLKGFGDEPSLALRIAVANADTSGALHNPDSLTCGLIPVIYAITDTSTANIKWYAPANKKWQYRIRVNVVGSPWSAVSPVSTSPTANITGLTSGTTYIIQIKQQCGGVWTWGSGYKFKIK